MKRYRLLTAAGVLGLCAMCTPAHAAPMDLNQVAADARWLGHLDFDAMRESSVVQNMMKQGKHKAHMAFVNRMLGINPAEDLHGMTFYGTEIGKHTGVMIVQASMDRERLTGMARRLPNHQVVKHRHHQVHHWTHKPRHGSRNRHVAAAFHGDHSLVFASSADLLGRALDVLDGKAQSLTQDSPLAGRIPPDTTMLLRAEGLSKAGLPEKCKLANRTRSFRLVTGEHDGQSFFRSRSIMTDKEVAAQVRALLEGLRALGQIHVGDNQTGQRLVNDLRIKTRGTTVTVLWKGSAKDVWTIIEAHQKILREKWEKYRKRDAGGHHLPWQKRWQDYRKDRKPAERDRKPDVPPEEDF
jgi:hypothetical protein